MRGKRVWNTDLLRALAAEGLTLEQMAERLGCDRGRLRAALADRCIRTTGMQSRPSRGPSHRTARRSARDTRPAPERPPDGLVGAEADIFMAGPSWTDIDRAAARHGLTMAEAQRIWHRVRGMA